ncbi:hypothetical protein LDL21_19035 [Nocardia sp. NEAU-G4]|nr:hypothetical protein [Nocardia rosealba]
MRPSSFLGPACCAAIAFAVVLPAQASADPVTDLLCNSGSSQFCPPPPPPPRECHPSYDPCVPTAPDADCAGGSGDGPAYTGPVRVIGPDEYGLDADGNGIGCQNS